MKIRKRFLSLIGALMLSGMLIAPAGAVTEVGTVEVSVNVVDTGGQLSVGIGSSSGFDFGNVDVNAVGGPGGVVNAGTATLVLSITGDTALFNENAFDITIRLANGYLAPDEQPEFEASSPANFQIPGRYLRISEIGNPLQEKYTGASGCATPYDGNATTTSAQCAPRAATGNAPIYKVSDPVGLFGEPDYEGGNCRITSGSTPAPWPTDCADPSFSDTSGKLIMHFRPGSGTIQTDQTINMTLAVPAGVYPGQYSGTLVIEQVPLI